MVETAQQERQDVNVCSYSHCFLTRRLTVSTKLPPVFVFRLFLSTPSLAVVVLRPTITSESESNQWTAERCRELFKKAGVWM